MVTHPLIPVLGRLRQNNCHEFENSLYYIVRPDFKKQNKTERKISPVETWFGVNIIPVNIYLKLSDEKSVYIQMTSLWLLFISTCLQYVTYIPLAGRYTCITQLLFKSPLPIHLLPLPLKSLFPGSFLLSFLVLAHVSDM